MKVALVVGSNCGHCGIRDYAVFLSEALQEHSVETQVTAPNSWGINEVIPWFRDLQRQELDIAHLQYPSIGQRRSLLPHLMGLTNLARHSVITLHEHTMLPSVQRRANIIFKATMDRMIFTTDYEARAFGSPSSPVIPIASNVPVYPERLEREKVILYFGQIRPAKGIEDFIALSKIVGRADKSIRFIIIGKPQPRKEDYLRNLKEQSNECFWIDDASLHTVARLMASSLAAYFPFPDGATWRRGSLIAAMANGLPVVTRVGQDTSGQLKNAVLQAETPEEAYEQIIALSQNQEMISIYSERGRKLVDGLNWRVVAKQHMDVYRSVTGS